MICWFSGCGNSRFVAETLASLLDERLVSIPEALRQGSCRLDLAPGERLGFVWPVYCWAPPPIVLDFVSRMSVSGSASHVFFVATCGDNARVLRSRSSAGLSGAGDCSWIRHIP